MEPKIRKGYAPEKALLLEVENTEWQDPWGNPHQAKYILDTLIVTRTDEYLPAELEAGTNGTEAVERRICVDGVGRKYICIGSGIWKTPGVDKYYYQPNVHETTRYLSNNTPYTGKKLLETFRLT